MKSEGKIHEDCWPEQSSQPWRSSTGTWLGWSSEAKTGVQELSAMKHALEISVDILGPLRLDFGFPRVQGPGHNLEQIGAQG